MFLTHRFEHYLFLAFFDEYLNFFSRYFEQLVGSKGCIVADERVLGRCDVF